MVQLSDPASTDVPVIYNYRFLHRKDGIFYYGKYVRGLREGIQWFHRASITWAAGGMKKKKLPLYEFGSVTISNSRNKARQIGFSLKKACH